MSTKAASAKAPQATSAKTPPAHRSYNTVPLVSGLMTPTSPPYPPYGGFMDPNHMRANGYDDAGHFQATYVYPLSPQFQYYSDGGNSYPGSPAIHPQSPAISPTSPPFSPPMVSPPMQAYMIHHQQPFPPLHISSPLLTGIPGSPPTIPYHLPALYDSRPHHKHHAPDYQYHTHNIYVRGLAENVTDESFDELCKSYGSVISSKAIIDQKSGQCKGYGFAMYENEDECLKAIEDLNARGLQASFARVGQESFSSRLRSLQDETSTNIYISNLPLDMTEKKLELLFQPYTTISNRILRDPQSNMSRGVGFARLRDRGSALAIIEKFNGETLGGSSAPLQVRFADSPAQKKLKNQTARKKMFRPPRDFQSMAAGFTLPGMATSIAAVEGRPMPITPEDMLGMAPAVASNNGYHHAPQHHHNASSPPHHDRQVTRSPINDDKSDDSDVRELIAETDRLNVS